MDHLVEWTKQGGVGVAIFFILLFLGWIKRDVGRLDGKMDKMSETVVTKADCQLDMNVHQCSIDRLEGQVDDLTKELYAQKGRTDLAKEMIDLVRGSDAS